MPRDAAAGIEMAGSDQTTGSQRPDGLEMLYRADGLLELRAGGDGDDGDRWIAIDDPVEVRQ